MQLICFPLTHQLENRIKKAKAGDIEEREVLINDYIPFIIKTVSNTLNRYIESEDSDEYIIGLEAFNEAIDKYDPGKGKFISFASIVIRSRVTDFMRRQKRYNDELMKCVSDQEDHQSYDTEDNLDLKAEIEEFEDRLKSFGITLNELVRQCPKHKDSRLNALRIARYIYSNGELKQELIRKRRLPVTSITRALSVSEKLINYNRIFIIASVLILDSDMECLKCYISEVVGGAENDI